MKLYQIADDNSSLKYYRLVLYIGAIGYFLWWFGIDYLFDNPYNPFLTRTLVSVVLFSIAFASYRLKFVKKHIDLFFSFGFFLGTIHFYHQFYYNTVNVSWITACFIVVVAVSAILQTTSMLISYAIFVLFLSALETYLKPDLQRTTFLPGVLTVLIFAYITLRSRLKLIEKVQEHAMQTRRILDSTFEGIILHDGKYILDVNESMARMFGYTRSEILGKKIFDYTTPESQIIAAKQITQAAESNYELECIRKDGSRFFVEAHGKQYSLKGKNIRIAALRDITERKRNEHTRILFEASQESLKVRNEFISIASHELKTPLTSIKLQTQMTQMRIDKGDTTVYAAETVKKLVNQIDKQADRVTSLIEDMLDISRISSGKLSIEKNQINLTQAIDETIDSLSDLIQQSGSELRRNIESDVIANVDKFRIEQAVTNLLTNAIKYGMGKAITVELKKVTEKIQISVSDLGIGIAKENHSRIFERFERAVAAKNISGLGLGLYISQQIILAHNGNITVLSAPNEGASFTITIPAD